MRYEPGTRYSNSLSPDIATDRLNEHGDTIFVQHREDGTPTGRESVVIGGNIYGAELAGEVHASNTREASPLLLTALQMALRETRDAMPEAERELFDAGKAGPPWIVEVRAAIAQALR